MKSISVAIMFLAFTIPFMQFAVKGDQIAIVLLIILCVLFISWLILMFKKER